LSYSFSFGSKLQIPAITKKRFNNPEIARRHSRPLTCPHSIPQTPKEVLDMYRGFRSRPNCNCCRCNEPARSSATVTSDASLVAAGKAHNCFTEEQELAQVNFPIQSYVSGFCPCEALTQGTMFPELVRLYK
jgi:hypothetical protein